VWGEPLPSGAYAELVPNTTKAELPIVNALTIYILTNPSTGVPKRTKPAEDNDEAYATVIETYKLMHRRTFELASKEGLTQPQFSALRVIARNGAMLMRDISEKMFVTPANLTGIVDRLEQKGLVRRSSRQGDRRATVIDLTPKGSMLQERVATRYSEFVHRALGALTAEEQQKLRYLLEKLQREMSLSS
jgi:MarR family 2-MHQ and catechol resistance regulon transcriptional repressor